MRESWIARSTGCPARISNLRTLTRQELVRGEEPAHARVLGVVELAAHEVQGTPLLARRHAHGAGLALERQHLQEARERHSDEVSAHRLLEDAAQVLGDALQIERLAQDAQHAPRDHRLVDGAGR